MLVLIGIFLHEQSASGRSAQDAQKIEELLGRYGRVIYELCLRYLGDRGEAEDAVQETFLRAYLALDTFRYGDDHLNWLYRIGTTSCLMILRTRRRKGATPVERIEETADTTASPEQYLRARQILEQLTSELDDRSLEIVAAHYIGGMSQGEVAEMLGISRRAVVKRLTSLRNKFDDVQRRGGPDA